MYLGIQNSSGASIAIEGPYVPPTLASAFIAVSGITDPVQQTAIQLLSDDIQNSAIQSKIKAFYPFIQKYRNGVWTTSSSTQDMSDAGMGMIVNANGLNGSVSTSEINPDGGTKTYQMSFPVSAASTVYLNNVGAYWMMGYNSNAETYSNASQTNPVGIIIDATTFNISTTTVNVNESGVIAAPNGYYRVWFKSAFMTYSIYIKASATNPNYLAFYVYLNRVWLIGNSTGNFYSGPTNGEVVYIYGLQIEGNSSNVFNAGFGAPTAYQKVPYNVDVNAANAQCYRLNFMNPTGPYNLIQLGSELQWSSGVSSQGGAYNTNINLALESWGNYPHIFQRNSNQYCDNINYRSYVGASIKGKSDLVNDYSIGSQRPLANTFTAISPLNTNPSISTRFAINSSNDVLNDGLPTNLIYGMTRTSSGTLKTYKNGAITNFSSPYNGVPDCPIYISALAGTFDGININIYSPSTRLLSCISIGEILADFEVGQLIGIMNNYNNYLKRSL